MLIILTPQGTVFPVTEKEREIILRIIKEKNPKILQDKKFPVKGVVTSKKCEHCGHYEIVIITEKGHHLSLKPGMKVELFKE
jgi:hypothetical protein